MIETCSPHRDGSSPVHLHSPHRIRYRESHLALGEIQRSLSRSPSKTVDFRHTLRSLPPSCGNTPPRPSPLSPSRRSSSDLFLNMAMSSPIANRNAGNRQIRPSLRRTTHTSSNLRTRTSPKSPTKRIVTDISNPPPTLRKRSSTEADREQELHSSQEHDKENKENSPTHDEDLGKRHVYTRQEKRRSGGSLMSFMPPPQSPMKRPEPVSTDTEMQSPSAKRRSLHGPMSGLDFSIFESESSTTTPVGSRTQDDNDWLRHTPVSSTKFSTIPKRASSLRKSTIQQRQTDRAANIKFSQPSEVGSNWFEATPLAKHDKSFRMSLDNQPLPRESPFSAGGHLLSASIHPTVSHTSQEQPSLLPTRHPLSRTMTQSSSTSSIPDDSPTHEPFHRPARPRSHDFSKSLPVGSSVPTPLNEPSEQSSQGSFATPGAYKSAKPHPAAFMSTGLISKKNRDVNDLNAGLPKAHMPDTPCKKQSVMFSADVKFNGPKAVSNRHSFGTPATPAEPMGMRPLLFSKSVGIFGSRSQRPSLMRKASFASIDLEDKGASQATTESDMPPTPTKHFDEPSRAASISPSPHHARNMSVPTFSGSQFVSSKLNPNHRLSDSSDEDGDGHLVDSPSAKLGPKSRSDLPIQTPSFLRSRLKKNCKPPTPLARSALVLSSLQSPTLKRAKQNVSPVTPGGDRSDRFSPHTPQESVFPPDPSGLSISGRGERPTTRNGTTPTVPATPTGPREYFPAFSHRPSLDVNGAHAASLDLSLSSRFEKVDLVGTGEFSQVYRVSQPQNGSPHHKIYIANGVSPSKNSTQEAVWAVKKSRCPYTGPRDRQRKLKEAEILKMLGRSDHVIGFVDSWENENYLYIQTEFCEEGTLGTFMNTKGARARIDDFRIWKIVLELSLVRLTQS
jgi:mitosis inhibitor protein kinase SWE1